jgi:hypothetical protein
MPVVNDVNELKKKFTTALEDGQVDAAEAGGLIDYVQENKVTQSERRQFREQFKLNHDAFAADAAKAMDDFIAILGGIVVPDSQIGNGERGPIDDTGVLSKDENILEWEDTFGDLFIEGAHYDDVKQGQIGDCYLAAALSAVAYQDPSAISDAIRDNGDGTYDVRFFERSGAGFREVHITIDGDLPLRNGGLRYAHARNAQELWVPLLEKAYAVWKGGFEAIGNGGVATRVMEALLGKRSSYIGISNANTLYSGIEQAIAAGKSVVAGTFGEEQEEMYFGTGIYADHAYTVLGVETDENGQRYIKVRNPWGEVERGNDGNDDGTFLVEIEVFQKLYQNVGVTG